MNKMEKDEIYEYVNFFIKTQEYILKWDRGNGVIEEIVLFDGLDDNKDLRFLFRKSKTKLDLEKIGGYKSIISIEGLELDAMI